jgi:hypothetical protein
VQLELDYVPIVLLCVVPVVVPPMNIASTMLVATAREEMENALVWACVERQMDITIHRQNIVVVHPQEKPRLYIFNIRRHAYSYRNQRQSWICIKTV